MLKLCHYYNPLGDEGKKAGRNSSYPFTIIPGVVFCIYHNRFYLLQLFAKFQDLAEALRNALKCCTMSQRPGFA